MAVDGHRECGGPPPRKVDTDTFIDHLAERLLRRHWQPLPPPVTEDDRQYRDDALSFALDRRRDDHYMTGYGEAQV
jgi:hypothetical protein